MIGKKVLLALCFFGISGAYSQTFVGPLEVISEAFISGENDIVFETADAVAQMWPLIEANFGNMTQEPDMDDYLSATVYLVPGLGNIGGQNVYIGPNVSDPFDGVGLVGAYVDFNNQAAHIKIYNIAQYVKMYQPQLIDNNGYFTIHMDYFYQKNSGSPLLYVRYNLRIATGYHFSVFNVEVCENTVEDLSMAFQTNYALTSAVTYQVNSSVCASGGGLVGSSYTAGNIVSNVVDTCIVHYSASSTTGINNFISSGEWFILNNLTLYAPNALFPNYSSSPSSTQYNGWLNKVVNCFDTASITISNNPVISFLPFPSPLYNNAAPFNLETYIDVQFEDYYSMSGPNVSYNIGNYYEFNPNITQGTHQINVYAERGSCVLDAIYDIQVQKWPSTPATPQLNWLASFNDSTELASLGNNNPVPCLDNGVFVDCNSYFRHKWLCAGRNLDADTIELFINGPNSGWNYEWKLGIDGLEQNLGLGISKKIARRNNPSPNLSNVYRETIYYRAQNTVGLWSSWEYVHLDYPVYWYEQNTPLQDMDKPGIKEISICHDGSIDVSYFDNQFVEDSVYSGGFGLVWNSGTASPTVAGAGNSHFVSFVSSNGQIYQEGDAWNLAYLGNKVQSDTIFENGHIRRQMPASYDSMDVCMCKTRNYVIESIRTPIIQSVTVPGTVMVGDIMNFSTSVDWSGIGSWHIDSNMFIPPFVGNSVNLYATGSSGWHSAYLYAVDSYGCSDDTLITNAFYVVNFVIDSVEIDTLIYVNTGGDLIGIDADAEVNGGNFIITPNNDGLNDFVNILNLNGRDYELDIFNRWGHIVMEVANDGVTIDVAELPTSTYYYRLHVDQKILSGFIEIQN